MRGPDADPGKAGAHGPARALAPRHGLPRGGGQFGRQALETHRLMPRRPSHADRWAPSPAVRWLRRQGGLAGTPHGGLPFDAHHVGQARRGQGLPKLGRVTVAGIRDDRRRRDALGLQRPDLGQGKLPFRLELEVVRDPDRAAATPILRPALRQVQPIGDGETDRGVGQRHAHGDLAVVLFAQGAAVLAGHADRVPALLGVGGVIHDPGGHRAVPGHRCQHPVSRGAEDGRPIPRGIGHKVMHRLVPRANMPRIDPGGHRLDALALARQAQPGEIGAHRLVAIGVSQGHGQPLDVLTESAGAGIRYVGHAAMLAWYPPKSPTLRDTVVLGGS